MEIRTWTTGGEVAELLGNESEVVDMFYSGILPELFNARLESENCLDCYHANSDGSTNCEYAYTGAKNARSKHCDYIQISDQALWARLISCKFYCTDVEEYLNDVFPGRNRTPIAPRSVAAEMLSPVTESGLDETDPGHHQQMGTAPHFATTSELLEYHRGRGVHELHDLARLVDDEFSGTARLTDIELGALLPAKGKEAKKPEGCRSQGKRLREKYMTSE